MSESAGVYPKSALEIIKLRRELSCLCCALLFAGSLDPVPEPVPAARLQDTLPALRHGAHHTLQREEYHRPVGESVQASG